MKNYSTENVSLENLHGKVEFCLTNDYLFRAVLHLATNEDKRYNIDRWASLFKADTWEKLKDISKQNIFMREAAKSMYIFAEDERVREELIRQKEFEATQTSMYRTIAKQARSIMHLYAK